MVNIRKAIGNADHMQKFNYIIHCILSAWEQKDGRKSKRNISEDQWRSIENLERTMDGQNTIGQTKLNNLTYSS